MVVWIESAVLDDPLLLQDKKFQAIKDKLVTFKWALFISINELINSFFN